MPKTLTAAKSIGYDYPIAHGQQNSASFNADRAKVHKILKLDGSTVGAIVHMYENATPGNKAFVYVERDISSLDFATIKSEWETANSPASWSDTISAEDLVHSMIHEKLETDLGTDTLVSSDGSVEITSVADV